MSEPYSRGNYDPVGRRQTMVVTVAVVVFASAAIVGLSALFGGRSAGENVNTSSRQSAEDTVSNPAAATGGTTSASEEIGEQTSTLDSAANSDDESGGGTLTQDQDEYEDAADDFREQQASDEGSSGEGSSGEDDPDRDGADSKPEEDKPVADEPSESFDPLGDGSQSPEEPTEAEPTEAEPTEAELTESGGRDRRRVEITVSRFVSAAYGYSGNDPTAYSQAIEAVVVPDFYSSTGGEWIGKYTDAVANGGIEATAALERFEIAEVSSDRVVGTAYFESGAVGEEPTDYYQRIMLSPSEEMYKVQAASKEKKVQ